MDEAARSRQVNRNVAPFGVFPFASGAQRADSETGAPVSAAFTPATSALMRTAGESRTALPACSPCPRFFGDEINASGQSAVPAARDSGG